MIYEQDTFSAGMDLLNPDVQVTLQSYVFLVNARSRYGTIDPVTLPVLQTQVPVGVKQGIISVGSSFILFVSGRAYYKLANSAQWIQVPNFLMSSSAQFIYSIAVPASTRDYIRALNASGNVQEQILQTVDSRVNGIPAGVVCQDGVNQPMFISFNENTSVFSARVLGTYALWTQTNQEYVPIGLFMMFLNQKLFVVSPDQTQVYQSVSGQALNFMVNITSAGNAGGDASTTSFAFDYDPITCIRAVNVTNSFLYATNNETRLITLDYTNTIFGEPLFDQAATIDTGITNQYAVVDINGDYAFANSEGLRNFNAVQQLKFEGRNSVFSKMISKLFKGIQLNYSVCFGWDNYALFAVNTACGTVFVVYDTLSSTWVGCDNFGIGQVIQTAKVDLPGILHLMCITANNEVYELYSMSAPTAQPAMLSRAFSTVGMNAYYTGVNAYANAQPPITDIKSQKVDLVFKDGTEDGTVSIIEFCDGVQQKLLTRPLVEADTVVPNSLIPEFQPIIEPEGTRVTFNFTNTRRGFKIGYLISWDTDASLIKIRLVTTDAQNTVSDKQKQAVLGNSQV